MTVKLFRTTRKERNARMTDLAMFSDGLVDWRVNGKHEDVCSRSSIAFPKFARRRLPGLNRQQLQQAALPKIAHIVAGGFLDEVRGKLQQTDLPAFVHALDNGAEGIIGAIDLLA